MGIIAVLVMMLIYLVLRSQSLQREASKLKYLLKSSDASYKFTFGALLLVTTELQKACLSKLQTANKHGLLNADDFELANFIVGNMEFVVMQCCERKCTVEEAVKKSLKASHYEFDTIREFIAKQPTEIRLPWCKNTLSGYIVACQNLSQGKIQSKSNKEEVSEKATS